MHSIGQILKIMSKIQRKAALLPSQSLFSPPHRLLLRDLQLITFLKNNRTKIVSQDSRNELKASRQVSWLPADLSWGVIVP